jgi:hypothetical protein
MKIIFVFLSIFLYFFSAINSANTDDKTSNLEQNPSQISTIRPSKSNNTFTLKKNNFQIETSFYSYSKDQNGGDEKKIKSVFDATNLRFGITNDLELNLIFSPLLTQEEKSQNKYSQQNYSSDLEISFRYNVFGNDEKNNQKSFALIPRIVAPTSTNEEDSNNYQAGLIFQYFQKLPKKFNLLLSSEPLLNKGYLEKNYHLTSINIINLNREIYRNLNAFIEFYNSKRFADKTIIQNSFNCGFVYQINQNFAIDFAFYLAASDVSADKVIQLGSSYLF